MLIVPPQHGPALCDRDPSRVATRRPTIAADMAVALRAPVCAKGRTGGKAVARRGVLQVRAAASSESAAPAAVAVLAPLGAVALSSALISSGTVSAECVPPWRFCPPHTRLARPRCSAGVVLSACGHICCEHGQLLSRASSFTRSFLASRGISSYLHTTAGFVFDAAAAGSVPECE